MRKCFDTNNDVFLGLLQIRSTSIGPGLPNSAALLFSRSLGGLLPKLSRPLILFDHDNDQYTAIIKRQ